MNTAVAAIHLDRDIFELWPWVVRKSALTNGAGVDGYAHALKMDAEYLFRLAEKSLRDGKIFLYQIYIYPTAAHARNQLIDRKVSNHLSASFGG